MTKDKNTKNSEDKFFDALNSAKNVKTTRTPSGSSRNRKRSTSNVYILEKKSIEPSKFGQPNQDKLNDQLFIERIAEQKQRRHFRYWMFGCFFLLLILQYALIAVFVGFAVKLCFVEQIQSLLGIIISGTLGETYAIIRVMVKFVFSPGDFEKKSK